MSSKTNTDVDEELGAAEAAWLEATTTSVDAASALLHEYFVIVHSPFGSIDGREHFEQMSGRMGPADEVTVDDVVTQRWNDVGVVSCIQTSRVSFRPGIAPFSIQAAVSRTWVKEDGRWLLLHMQMCRRVQPGPPTDS